MSGSENFEHILGVLATFFIKQRVVPTSMGFLILHLRSLLFSVKKGSCWIQCFYCFSL